MSPSDGGVDGGEASPSTVSRARSESCSLSPALPTRSGLQDTSTHDAGHSSILLGIEEGSTNRIAGDQYDVASHLAANPLGIFCDDILGGPPHREPRVPGTDLLQGRYTGALIECDTNSPRRPRDVKRPAVASPPAGVENVDVSAPLLQGSCLTGPSIVPGMGAAFGGIGACASGTGPMSSDGEPSAVSLSLSREGSASTHWNGESFNMSPLEDERLSGAASRLPLLDDLDSLRRGSSTDTLTFTSTAPSSSIASSRRESLGMRAEGVPAEGPCGGGWTAAAGQGQRQDQDIPDGPEGTERMSRVAAMRSLWEERTGGKSSGSSSGGGTQHSCVIRESRGPGRISGQHRVSPAWLRCASDVMRRMRRLEDHNLRLTDRLMRRLQGMATECNDAFDVTFPSSPFASSLSSRSCLDSSPSTSSLSESQDEASPVSKMQKDMDRKISNMLKMQREFSKATLRVTSLDGAFGRVASAGPCSRCTPANAGDGAAVAGAVPSSAGATSEAPHRLATGPPNRAPGTSPQKAGGRLSPPLTPGSVPAAPYGPAPRRSPRASRSPKKEVTTPGRSPSKVSMTHIEEEGAAHGRSPGASWASSRQPEEELLAPSRSPRGSRASVRQPEEEAVPPGRSPRASRASTRQPEEEAEDQLPEVGGDTFAIKVDDPDVPDNADDPEPAGEPNPNMPPRQAFDPREPDPPPASAPPTPPVTEAEEETQEPGEGSERCDSSRGSVLSEDAEQWPRAGEDGMLRASTLLQLLEMQELQKKVEIVVPEGMGPDRRVAFTYENRRHEYQLPEHYKVGERVLLTIPKTPPLERNPVQAWYRGHATWPDRYNVVENLRHGLANRPRAPCTFEDPESWINSNCALNDQDSANRRQLYSLLRGQNMQPLLPETKEEAEEDIEAEIA